MTDKKKVKKIKEKLKEWGKDNKKTYLLDQIEFIVNKLEIELPEAERQVNIYSIKDKTLVATGWRENIITEHWKLLCSKVHSGSFAFDIELYYWEYVNESKR